MLLVLASGCTSDLKRPEVAITGVTLSGITPGESYVDVGIAIFNQNRIPVRIDHTDLRLFYWNGTSWDPLGTANKGEFQVHANGETRILVPVSLNNTALCDLFWYLIYQPDVKVRIEGEVYADLLITSYPVSFEDERAFSREDVFILIANALFRSLTGISLLPANHQ